MERNTDKHKNIALIMAMLQSDFSTMVLEGAIRGARETGVNLYVFPIGVIGVDYNDYLTDSYARQFDALKEFICSRSIDAAVVEYGTIVSLLDEAGKRRFLNCFGDVPLVLLNEKAEGYAGIEINSRSGLKEVVDHLIDEHHLSRIGYVSGPQNNHDAVERLQVYREAMEAHGLDFNETYIAYGNFSVFSEDVIEELCKRHPDLEALVCANDNMAIAAYQVLARMGKIPGQDVIVTGFDDIQEAILMEPQLTTVKAEIRELSYQAMLYLAHPEQREHLSPIPTHILKRGSCGCHQDDYEFASDKEAIRSRIRLDAIRRQFEFNLSNITNLMVSSRVTEQDRYHAVFDIVRQLGCASSYLYLYQENTEDAPDRQLMFRGYYDRETEKYYPDGECPVTICDLFSYEWLPQDHSYEMLVMPLYFGERHYGLLLVEAEQAIYPSFFQLAMQISSTLEILYIMEQMKDTQQQLVLANEFKSQFLANMSHEIRTPINAVLGMNEMVLRESRDDEIRGYALDIQSAGKNLLSIINDILDFSKIEAGKMDLVPEAYDLGNMLHDIMNMITFRAKSKDLTMELILNESLPSGLYGDDVRIRQILINVLTNAVKYTREGGVKLYVDGEIIDSDTLKLHCEVEDTGIGIKEEDLSKLFEKFQRIEEKRNRSIEGTGLGMSITLGLLTLMGSSLQVKSVYGKGSVFSFDLEQKIVSHESVGDLNARIRKQMKEQQYEQLFTAPDAEILVVDDNTVNRKVFRNLLKATRIAITEAGSGQECITYLEQKPYDAVFMDHLMPDMDGIETLKILKQRNLIKDTPVIVLTANAISGMREMYLNEGFDDYLTKPIVPEKLEEMLVRYLPEDKVEYSWKEQGPIQSQESIKDQQEPIQNQESKQDQQQSNSDARIQEIYELPGMNLKYAMLYHSKTESLWETIIEFVNTMLVESKELEKLYSDHDFMKDEALMKNYRIKVHGMKSAMAMIGAMQLSGVAALLERAANDCDYQSILPITPIFLRECKELLDRLYPMTKQARENAHGQIVEYNEDELRELLDELIIAIQDMDIDIADDRMERIQGMQMPECMVSVVEELYLAAQNLSEEDVIECADRIKELMLREI